MGCTKYIVKGKVQGVFYRKYVSKNFREKGYIGYVKNLNDGSVEVVIKQEPNQNITEILEIIKEGSPKSIVESISIAKCEETNFSNSFEVRY